MTAVKLSHVNKKFPEMGYPALNDVNVQIEEGEFITILGTSGCGKTTMIKTINRLYEPDSGTIELFGEDISKTDAVLLRRKIGYVIQQAGLFPHKTVAENIAVVPKILKWPKKEMEEKTNDIMKLVALDPEEFKNRYPAQLSGGQQQRVGLARALIADPPIILFDEPFGAIDAINREMLQNEVKRIQQESRKTYLFVTHDIREAFKLGDRVIIMNQGEIVRFGTPEEIAADPGDAFVEELLGTLGADSTIVTGGEEI